MRRKAKVINFGIMYGMGASALAENLTVPRKEASVFLEEYRKQFPKLNTYLESVVTDAKKNGYTTTFFGRKRNLSKINSVIPFIRAMYERMAINAPIQGTAADIIKLAMIRTHETLHEQGLDTHVKLLLQIHDEIIFEAEEQYAQQATEIITQTMQQIIPESFVGKITIPPFLVSVSMGKTWAELK
jgi:DNA polymerase-1